MPLSRFPFFGGVDAAIPHSCTKVSESLVVKTQAYVSGRWRSSSASATATANGSLTAGSARGTTTPRLACC